MKKEEFLRCYKWFEVILLYFCFAFSAYVVENHNLLGASSIQIRLLDLAAVGIIAIWWHIWERFTRVHLEITERGNIPSLKCILLWFLGLSVVMFFINLFLFLEPVRSIYATLGFFCLSSVALVLSNVLLLKLSARFFNCSPMTRRLLLVGTGPRAVATIERELKKAKECQIISGVLDIEERKGGFYQKVGGIPFMPVSKLREILSSRVVDEVIIALPIRSYYDLIENIIEECVKQGIAVTIHPIWDIERISEKTDVGSVRMETSNGYMEIHTGSPLLDSTFNRLVRRVIDVSIAWIMVILLSPIMILTALAIKVTSRGPVLFKQKRVGKGKRIFDMFKFRTMYEGAETMIAELEEANVTNGAAFKMINDPRITPVGRFLRKTSIDELPQLFNVIKGDMSLVGPRPLPLRDYERFYDDHHFRRFSVSPGITGLWQVSGRSLLNFEEWMALDLFYVDNWSFKLDLQILSKTIKVVLRGTGAM